MAETSLRSDLRRLAAAHHFRSATVGELILDDAFCRRPLRPEDLDFLEFARPVSERDFDQLASLMSHRALLSLNEGDEAVLPSHADPAWLEEWRSFFDPDLHRLGRSLRAELEGFALGFLEDAPPADLSDLVGRWGGGAAHFWHEQMAALKRAGYAREGLGFALVQQVPLWQSVLAARLSSLPELARIWNGGTSPRTTGALETEAGRLGLRISRHPYWQFYLPGSLAVVNLLHKLGRSPWTVCEFAGARFVADLDRLRLLEAIRPEAAERAAADEALRAELQALVAALHGCFGATAAERFAAGAGWMAGLLALARRGLSAQLAWLSDLSWTQAAARQISAKIERDCPDIDRDTFVEPREMCSTTHVHDEHRLVVIESGRMAFWGNVGMRHEMGVGEMILVPKGRLHGSTVLSSSCTYHQPIIPDDWQPEIPAWRGAAA